MLHRPLIQHCKSCGSAVTYRVPDDGDTKFRAVCPSCHTIHYENPLIVAALDESLKTAKPKPFIASADAGAAEAIFSLATSMTDDQSIDIALLYTQLALTFNAELPVMYTLLGDTYESMKRYDKAIAAYEKVPADSPIRTNADMEIAVSLQRLDRKDEALVKLKELIARVRVHIAQSRAMHASVASLDATGRLMMATDAQGRMLWCTPRAEQALALIALAGY